jgi:signal transduction histidine kinase
VKVALFRIAQEALNNVAKHARAHRAEVRLQQLPEAVELSVTDDGRGFHFESMPPHRLGLDLMRDYAATIGATLAMQSHPGQGTKIVVRWPTTDKK